MSRGGKSLSLVVAVALAAAPRAASASDFFDCLKAAGPDELKAAGDATVAVATLVDDPACTALTGTPVYVGLAAAIAATSIAANASGNKQLMSVFGDAGACQSAPTNAALTIANVLLPLIPGLNSNQGLMDAIKAGDSAAAASFLTPALQPFLEPYDCACKFADLTKDAKKLLNDGLQTVTDAEACGRLLGSVVESVGEDVEHLNPGCCLAPGTTGSGGNLNFYSCPANECAPVPRDNPIGVECGCPPPRVLSPGGACACPGGVFTGWKKTPGAGSCDASSGPTPDFRVTTYGGSCSKCPAHTLPDTMRNECVPLDCPTGKRPGATLGSCVNVCPVSKTFDKASGRCVACDDKSVPDAARGVGCVSCPPGQVVGTPRSGVDFENLAPQCVTLKPCPAGMVHMVGYASRCIPCDDGFAPEGLFDCKPTAAGLAKAKWLAKCMKLGMKADETSTTQGCSKCPGRSKPWAASGFPGECHSEPTLPPPPPPGTGPKKQPLKQ